MPRVNGYSPGKPSCDEGSRCTRAIEPFEDCTVTVPVCRSPRAEPQPDLGPGRRLARRGISVDAPLVRRVDFDGPVLGKQPHAALGPAAAQPVAMQNGGIDADESAAA